MGITFEALNILIMLAPGLLSTIIYNTIIVRKDKDPLSKIFEALVYTIIIYIAVHFVCDELPCYLKKVETDNKTYIYSFTYNILPLCLSFLLALLLPLFIGYINHKNYIGKLFAKINLTNKSSRESVWLDVFTDVKKCVIVTLKTGERVYGWPTYYSNDSSEGLIYLEKPKWVKKDGTYIDMKIHGILLTLKDNVKYVSFLNYPTLKPPKKRKDLLCQKTENIKEDSNKMKMQNSATVEEIA